MRANLVVLKGENRFVRNLMVFFNSLTNISSLMIKVVCSFLVFQSLIIILWKRKPLSTP